HRRRRAGRGHVGPPPGPARGVRRPPRSPQGLRPRVPRRHSAPLGPGNPGRDRPGRATAPTPAREGPQRQRADRRRAVYAGRSPALEDALPLHHAHSPGAVPRIHYHGGPALSALPPGDGGERPAVDRGERERARRALPGRRRLARGTGSTYGRRGRAVLAPPSPGRLPTNPDLATNGRALAAAATPA